MIAALLAPSVGARWGRRVPLVAGASIRVATMLAIAWLGGSAFAVVAALFMGAYMFSTPHYYATRAAADASGRAVAFRMSVRFCGLRLGPLLGPRLNPLANGFGAIWASIALIVVAVGLISIAGSGMKGS